MNDKKQIEEMARLIKLPIGNWLEDTEAIPPATTYYAELMGCINDSAEVLFNENYRKIPKDSVAITKEELKKIIQEEYQNALKDKVVLTREEYRRLLDNAIRVDMEYLDHELAQARKETAIEFSEKVKSKIKELKQGYHEDCINGLGDGEYNGLTENNVDEILKEMDVEL